MFYTKCIAYDFTSIIRTSEILVFIRYGDQV